MMNHTMTIEKSLYLKTSHEVIRAGELGYMRHVDVEDCFCV